MNMIKTGLLMMVMTMLFVFAGAALGGQAGIIFALGFAVISNFIAYWFSDRMVLAAYKAKEVDRNSAPALFEIVEKLAKRADLPMPRVYIIPSEQPNAFATGRNPQHAAVAVTEGLFRILDERALSGVLAHELAHVKHRDILIGSVAGTMAGAISSLAWMAKWGAIFGGVGRSDDDNGGIIGLLVMAIVAPLVALLIQMAISRSREYHADQYAAELTGDPRGLGEALKRIHQGVEALPMKAGPATAHLFIASPISGRALMNLVSTHPPMEKRVERLEALAGRMAG